MSRPFKEKKEVIVKESLPYKENLAEKKKSLTLALAQIEKQFGKGSIMTLGQNIKVDVPAIPTGAMALDVALGVGGIPRGRVIEIFGPESSGKTTLTLSVIAQAQKRGGTAAFIDAEHAFDSTYAKKLGVNLDDLLISQPDTGEQALEITEMLVRSNAIDVIVVDSVAALVPKAEIEGEMGASHVGLQARLMSHALRKLTGSISKSKSALIFINQLREKIGIMFGNPETTPGGRALKFYSSVRLDIRRIAQIKRGEENVGGRVRVKVVKNKVAPPFKQAEFDLLYDEGISAVGSLLDMAETFEIIKQSGSWVLYGEDRLGQGRENAKAYLRENPKVMHDLEKKVLDRVASLKV
ncbi:MAG: recombinase RecA [Candidatus Omnitrophica bacterium]|nr:recombinase RecA [Candidatus Omnitrophota bacterium]